MTIIFSCIYYNQNFEQNNNILLPSKFAGYDTLALFRANCRYTATVETVETSDVCSDYFRCTIKYCNGFLISGHKITMIKIWYYNIIRPPIYIYIWYVVGETCESIISFDLRAWRAALTSDPVVRHDATAADEHASSLRSDTAHVGTSFRRTIIIPIVVRVFFVRF